MSECQMDGCTVPAAGLCCLNERPNSHRVSHTFLRMIHIVLSLFQKGLCLLDSEISYELLKEPQLHPLRRRDGGTGGPPWDSAAPAQLGSEPSQFATHSGSSAFRSSRAFRSS